MNKITIIVLVAISFLSWSLFAAIYLVNKNNAPVRIQMPQYYQVFPIERYPGMKCYVIRSDVRELVITTNCEAVYVQSDNITIGNYVIPRQSPGMKCNRCYLSDYLNVVGFILFGRPEDNIEPLAPKGAVILEDDIVVCNDALLYLDQCFQGQYNCILGDGAWMNFFAGAQSEQPEPGNYSGKRFSKIEELIDADQATWQPHVDWYIVARNRHGIRKSVVNHMNSVSTLSHNIKEQINCRLHNESIAGPKVIVDRHKDIRIYRD